ncbi:hypothetical protein CBG46_09460 [Actinobacillus succinogenes]|uniref:O-antigen polymerase n=1 Tax=Actinobacillus succinogenes (strain ATCC 55618 / DSM 22257 / CCUG 43843 / 130Z) TaxID=339671 RepID=A6VNZ7_ACTSZ|nr:hypothetical protein [Actinobacillus succinogenes]ABR74694.1 conserved hypothetical protein [Actinobacillus succinogenes 130Z]PHI40885.1 hypothetical protein CBG46_09460 [Actinobacillus succinogenes]
MSALINLFYLYDPWLFHVLRMSLFIGFLSLLWLGYKWYRKEIKRILIPVDSLLVCTALIGISVVPILINGTSEFGVISMYIKSLVIFIFGIVIYNLFYCHQSGKRQFIRDVNVGIGVQSALGALALAGIPLFVTIALGTNSDMGGQLSRFIGSEQEYRLYNFTSSAFFPLSAFYLMLLHFLLAYGEKKENLNTVYLFLILAIGLISGRTFFIFSVVSLAIYFRLRYIPAIAAFAVVVLFLAYRYPAHPYVAHALEPLINLIYGGAEASISSSTDTLIDKHLFTPEIKQLIMGDGRYYVVGRTSRSYYGGSDSGFIRQALYGGVGYILACFLFTAYFVKRVADNWFNGSWKFILSALLLLSVLNIKADTYAYPGIMMTFLMFVSLFGDKGRIIERS